MPTKKKPAPQKPAAGKAAAKKAPCQKDCCQKSAGEKSTGEKSTGEKACCQENSRRKKPLPKRLRPKKRPPKMWCAARPSGFRVNEHIVYPAHGVGLIVEISEQEIAGMSLELFVINFEKEKMVLRVPIDKAEQTGMRKLADNKVMDGAIRTLKGRARIKRTMWSRRAQEYEAKINSGDLIAIAEVVRDLFRNENQPEQSYSERQLYEAALERMAREVATVEKTTEDAAIVKLEAILAKTTGGARRQPGSDAA